MIVFYVPAWAMGPWSTMAMAWMLWVCARHRAMRSHPKRTEDEEERGGRAPAAPVQQQQQQCSYHHHHHHPPRPQHPRQGLAAAPRPAHPVHLLPDPPPPAPLPLACMEVDRGVGQGGSGGDGGGGVREKVVGVGVETVEDNDHGVLQALQAAKAQHQQKAEASLRLF